MGESLSVGEALLLWLLTVTGLGALAVIALSVAAVKVARLLVEGDVTFDRPIPARRQLRRPSAALDDEDELVIDGVHGHPPPPASTPAASEQLDDTPVVTEILGDVDSQLQADREQWWKEQRAKGLSDAQIADLEARHVVKVFS